MSEDCKIVNKFGPSNLYARCLPLPLRLRARMYSSCTRFSSRRAHLLHAIFVYARTSLARDLPSTRGLTPKRIGSGEPPKAAPSDMPFSCLLYIFRMILIHQTPVNAVRSEARRCTD